MTIEHPLNVKEFRRFKEKEYFENKKEYYLLPFRFIELNEVQEVLVNEVGDYLIVPRGTANRIVNRELSGNEGLYADLIANFFISTTPVPHLIDILATKYRTKKAFLDNFTALHIFVVTLRCNHSCHYCQVSRVSESLSDFDITYKNLDYGIDHMFRSPSHNITMEFQGGEPLLAFDKIKYAIERAREINLERNKNIHFVICTNSTVFTDEILNFCSKHNVIISTSLDGPEFIHNANRPKSGAKSYELVINGIAAARQKLGFDKVSCLMTTTILSLEHPKEIIDEYVNQGFSNIFLRPISPYGFAIKNRAKNEYQTNSFIKFYEIGLEYILELNKNGKYIVEDYTVIILKKILTAFPVGYVDLQSPAGMVNNVIVFNYDGAVYATDEARMLAENGDFTFRLGSVADSYTSLFYGEKVKEIAKHWSNESLAGCSDCAFQSYCGADPVFHHAAFGDLEGLRPSSDFCTKNMAIFKYIFSLLNERYEEVMPIFSSWITNSKN